MPGMWYTLHQQELRWTSVIFIAALRLWNSLSMFEEIPTLQVQPPRAGIGTLTPSLAGSQPAGQWPRCLGSDTWLQGLDSEAVGFVRSFRVLLS